MNAFYLDKRQNSVSVISVFDFFCSPYIAFDYATNAQTDINNKKNGEKL